MGPGMNVSTKRLLSRRSLVTSSAALAAVGAVRFPSDIYGQESTSGTLGGTLSVGTSRLGSQVFNPLNFLARQQQIVFEAIFMRLIYSHSWGDGLEFDPTTDIELAIANSLEVIETDRIWEITLRDEVTWHDGSPVVADDVILGTWLALHPDAKQSLGLASPVGIKGAARIKAEGGTEVAVEGWTKIDDKTLRLELETPIANYWQNPSVAYWPMPNHLLGALPVAEALSAEPFATNPVGNGPFKVSHYEVDQFIELVPFDDFYEGRALLDKLIFRFGDTDTLAAALEAQEIDIFDGPGYGVYGGPEFVKLTTLPDTTTISPTHPSPWGMCANWERFPEQAGALNKAMMYGIDMSALNTSLYGNTLTLTNNPLQHLADYQPATGIPYHTYDPGQARQVLEDAGWDTGTELSFLVINTPTNVHVAIAEMLNQIGLKSTFNQFDSTQMVEKRDIDRDFDICLFDTPGTQDLLTISNSFTSGMQTENGGRNFISYANSQVDELFQQALDTTDPDEVHAILDQILLIWSDEPAVATLYYPSHPYIFNNRVKGALPGKAQESVRPVWERVWLEQS